jgi:hypothetical protein
MLIVAMKKAVHNFKKNMESLEKSVTQPFDKTGKKDYKEQLKNFFRIKLETGKIDLSLNQLEDQLSYKLNQICNKIENFNFKNMIKTLGIIWKSPPNTKNFEIKFKSGIGIKVNCVGEYKRTFYILHRLFMSASFLSHKSKEKLLIHTFIVSQKALEKLQGDFCYMVKKKKHITANKNDLHLLCLFTFEGANIEKDFLYKQIYDQDGSGLRDLYPIIKKIEGNIAVDSSNGSTVFLLRVPVLVRPEDNPQAKSLFETSFQLKNISMINEIHQKYVQKQVGL